MREGQNEKFKTMSKSVNKNLEAARTVHKHRPVCPTSLVTREIHSDISHPSDWWKLTGLTKSSIQQMWNKEPSHTAGRVVYSCVNKCIKFENILKSNFTSRYLPSGTLGDARRKSL